MTGPSEDAVREALTGVIDPEIRRSIVELDMVESIVIEGGKVTVTVLLTIAGCPLKDTITKDTKAAVAGVDGVAEVAVVLGTMTPEQRKEMKEKLQGSGTRDIPFNRPESLTKVYAIASGKGGVGKSSVTANLAVSLADKGLRVGIVDADIYGFSIPGMLGLSGKPTRVDEMILPQVAHDVKVMSIGMFVPPSQAVVWRGPMLHRALQQFLTDVFWGDLDVLLLDLPPGTGDIAISVAQLLPDPSSSSSPHRSRRPPKSPNVRDPSPHRRSRRWQESSRTCHGWRCPTALGWRCSAPAEVPAWPRTSPPPSTRRFHCSPRSPWTLVCGKVRTRVPRSCSAVQIRLRRGLSTPLRSRCGDAVAACPAGPWD